MWCIALRKEKPMNLAAIILLPTAVSVKTGGKGCPQSPPPMSRTLGGNCGNRGSLRLELEPVRKG
jgi:hypothetical protein